MSAELLLSWREGVSASDAGDGTIVVQGPHRRLALRRLTPAVQRALCRLTPPGEEEHRLAELVADGNGGLARWYYYLERLTRGGLLCHRAHAERTPLATLVAVSPGYVAQRIAITAEQRYVLSRFAYLHRIGAAMVLESPLALARVVLNDGRAADLIARLNAPVTLGGLAKQVDSLESPSIAGVLALLAQAGMLQAVSAAGAAAEDDDPALQTWEFHDLLFHARSRSGRSDSPFGATFRLLGRVEPPPVLKQPPTGAVHVLYRPDLARLQRDDPPFAHVQECRQTVRNFDRARPITAHQLGEFLFRVGRVREHRTVEFPTPHGLVRMDVAGRPYPAGGALYELEFYVVVISCAQLAGGLYHYDPAQHQLVRLDTRAEDVAALARDAAESTGICADELQVLIVLAARFPRIAWKYQSIAYALTLKHVGVVYQTMYLAATAMGLAPCAVGGGDADRFARAAGTAYAAETSVGELLGSRLPDSVRSSAVDFAPIDGLKRRAPTVGEYGEPQVPRLRRQAMRKLITWSLVLAIPALSVATAQQAAKRLIAKEEIIELVLLRQKSVREDLKLDSQATKQIFEFTYKQHESAEAIHKLPEAEQKAKWADLVKANKQFLSTNLTPEQRKRLEQISMQVAGLLWVNRPSVAKHLKLTDDQKAKAEQLRKETHEAFIKVLKVENRKEQRAKLEKLNKADHERLMNLLTDDQKTTWKTLAGAPFKGDLQLEQPEAGSK